jgi:Na+-transporting NADH:ubiquinone oxidoreductase subunit B
MANTKKLQLLNWQAPMKRVLYALVPVALASVYFFGWRALVVLAVTNGAAFLTELVYTRVALKTPVTSAVLVTGTLLALSLPPAIPLWIAAVGAVFGVLFGKMVFGGFGRNVFNPALVGRVFIYVSFAVPMTSRWLEPLAAPVGPLSLPGSLGGFARWVQDAVSGATPLGSIRAGQPVAILPLLWGNVAGCLGETSALLITLSGIYLLATKTANWRIMLSTVAGYVGLEALLWLLGVRNAADPLTGLLSGGLLYGVVFMATDPVSAAQTQGGRFVYGTLIGVLVALIRVFSVWPEGTMFAILLGNTFAPILDYAVRLRQKPLVVKGEG